jgi:hypothetical protein
MRGAKLFAMLIILVLVISPGLVTHSMSCWQQLERDQYLVSVSAVPEESECYFLTPWFEVKWDDYGQSVTVEQTGENLRFNQGYVYRVVLWMSEEQFTGSLIEKQDGLVGHGVEIHRVRDLWQVQIYPYVISQTTSPYNRGISFGSP